MDQPCNDSALTRIRLEPTEDGERCEDFQTVLDDDYIEGFWAAADLQDLGLTAATPAMGFRMNRSAGCVLTELRETRSKADGGSPEALERYQAAIPRLLQAARQSLEGFPTCDDWEQEE